MAAAKAIKEALRPAGGGGRCKLALEISGKVIKDRKDRVTFLKEHGGVSVFDAKLDDLLPKPAKKVKDGIQNAQLILITSQEIDELGEADNMSQARLQIDGVVLGSFWNQIRPSKAVYDHLYLGKSPRIEGKIKRS